MKQNLPSAKALSFLAIAFILSTSGCAKLTRPPSSTFQDHLAASQANKGSQININTAPAQELEKLPGVGKGIAERIIKHREQYGPFRRPEHLMMVRGISDRKFRALRDLIAVN